MAVFTKLNKKEIEEYIEDYNIGKLDGYSEIIEGIENTNYKIICDGIPYILTIFEKRVNEKDLPFFIDLKSYLNKHNFKCPLPKKNKNGKVINSIKNKKAIIISFIEGKKVEKPSINECLEFGRVIGNFHNLTINFDKKRENSLDIKEWKYLYKECERGKHDDFKNILTELHKEIIFLENSWPKELPSGIIHADLFRDNVFFKDEKISGIIDFYFSCFHFLLYDISIVINDWCFEKNGEVFKLELFNAILNGYKAIRPLNNSELKSFNILLRAAAVRILVTRLYDFIFHPVDAIVIKKDPFQYYNILKWHQINSVIDL